MIKRGLFLFVLLLSASLFLITSVTAAKVATGSITYNDPTTAYSTDHNIQFKSLTGVNYVVKPNTDYQVVYTGGTITCKYSGSPYYPGQPINIVFGDYMVTSGHGGRTSDGSWWAGPMISFGGNLIGLEGEGSWSGKTGASPSISIVTRVSYIASGGYNAQFTGCQGNLNFELYESSTPTCTENWQCGQWSSCSSAGTQARTCTDSNNCGTTTTKLATSQSCTPTPTCGNGKLDSGEKCDKLGNIGCSPGDTCKDDCTQCIPFQYSTKLNLEGYDDPTNITKYVGKTRAERLFDPLKAGTITPFDDVVCEIQVPQGVAPPALNLVAWDNAGIKSVILPLNPTKVKTVNKIDYYQAKITGWKDGWKIDNSFMDKISQGILKEVSCEPNLANYDNKNSERRVLDSCVHVWGKDDAKFKVVGLRGKSSYEIASWIVARTDDNQKLGFGKVDPFMTFKDQFSHYADLKEINDALESVAAKQQRTSSCGSNARIYTIYSSSIILDMRSNLKSEFVFGYTYPMARTIFIYPGRALPLLFVHEAGHAMAGLQDEYLYREIIRTIPDNNNERNCVDNPAKFTGYGDSVWTGCENYPGLYKPTVTSIMNTASNGLKKFNVISCGYLINSIKNNPSYTKMQQYWQDCMSLDTIKPNSLVCSIDLDCTTDNSQGCAKCQKTLDGKGVCVFQGVGQDCTARNKNSDKLQIGSCVRPDSKVPLYSCLLTKDAECDRSGECSKKVGDKYAFGTCVLGRCRVDPQWECSGDSSNILGALSNCFSMGMDKGCVDCVNHKCIASKGNRMRICFKEVNGEETSGYCDSSGSGKCL